jgi:bacteriorhodopsin
MSEYKDNKITTTLAPTVSLVPTPPAPEPTKTLGQETPKDKVDLAYQPEQYYIKASFMITYILLLTTATITFIEAICTNVPEIRHILNIETAISLIAGYFYSVFLTQINDTKNQKFDLLEVSKTRYIDWSITTPLMLFNLVVFLSYETKQEIGASKLAIIIILDYIMLGLGFCGESKIFNRTLAFFLGFVAFFVLYYYIFINFVKTKVGYDKSSLFVVYVVLWSFYGVSYMLPETYKIISYNILDCIAKCFVGIGIWLYYTKVIKFNK